MGKRWILKESQSGKGYANPPSPQHRPASSWKARLPEPVAKDGVKKVDDEEKMVEEGEKGDDKKNVVEAEEKNEEREVDQEMVAEKPPEKKKEKKNRDKKEKKEKDHKKEYSQASGSTESRKALKVEKPVDKSPMDVKAELSPTEPDDEMTNEELNERLQAALEDHGVYRYFVRC